MPRASRRAAAKAAAGSGNTFELQMALAMSLSEPAKTSDAPPPAKLRKSSGEPAAGCQNGSKHNSSSSSSRSSSSSSSSSSVADSPSTVHFSAVGTSSSAPAASQEAAANDNYVDPLPPTLLVIDRERPLKSLGESGLIPFGEKVLHMKYKQYEWWADVRPDGTITHHGGDGTEYVNPSSFSLAMKRQVKADVVSDSGWESLKYNGRKLSHVRDGVETLLRERKERRSRSASGHVAGTGLSKAQQTAIFKGLDRKKEALVKEVITHYNVTKVEDNAAARLKRRQKQSKRNYEHLAKIMKKLKQKDRYAFFQDDDLRRTNPTFESSIPHPYIDFKVMDQRYRASKRVFSSPSSSPTGANSCDEGLYMALVLAGDGSGTGIAEIQYDRLLRDVTQIAENARAFFPPSDDAGTAHFEAGWMLAQCKQVISSFQKRVTQTLSAQRRKDLLEMIREKNRQPCVQGKWHKMPYSKREYRAITAYEPSECLRPHEAERVMRKLKTSMTREDFVAAVEKEDWELQRLVDAAAAKKRAIADAIEANRNRRLKLRKKSATREANASTSAPATADGSGQKAVAASVAGSSDGKLSVDADHQANAKSEPQSADHLALEVAAQERRTVKWQRLQLSSGDIIERDTWGIDCYTRKNIELALGLVPAPLTMTRSQATFFIENVFLPAVNAVEDPTLAHDIQNTIKLLLDWYSGPAPHGTLDETGPPLPTDERAGADQKREYIVAPIGEDTVCAICGSSERPEEALLCDGPGCDKEFHMSCLDPPLQKVPDGDFVGPCCGGHGCGADSASKHSANQKKADEDAERMMEQAPARFVVRSDGERTWIPSLADPRAPRREQIAAGVRKIAAVCQDVGLLHFAIHPKGCGVICATDKTIPANRFVTEYLGSVYPAWKWAQKDREEEEQRKLERAQQQRLFLERAKARQTTAGKGKSLQQNLHDEDDKVVFQVPEFYNIRLERNRSDPEGYDLLYVDAKDHAAFSSRMSHSCAPNCALEGTVLNGQYVIAVRTLRPIRPGEELTQDYNCVTESEEEFRAAVCLCGGVTCRGSFLNFTGATMASLLLKQHHTQLQRLGMLCTACHGTDFASKDNSVKAGINASHSAGTDVSSAPAAKDPPFSKKRLVDQISSISCLGTSALADQPSWSLRWCAAVLRFMNNERKFLPQELEEMQKIMKATGATIGAVENIRLAASVFEQRTSNLVTALDIIRHFVSSEATPTTASEAFSKADAADAVSAPFRKLNGTDTAEFLVYSEKSVLRQTLRHTDTAIRAILRNTPDSAVRLALSNPTSDSEQAVASVWNRLQQTNEKVLASWNRVEAELSALLNLKGKKHQSPSASAQPVPNPESSSGLSNNTADSGCTGIVDDEVDQVSVSLLEASDVLRQWANTILSFASESNDPMPAEISSSSTATVGGKLTGIAQTERNESVVAMQSSCSNVSAPSAEKKSSRKRTPKPTSMSQMATIADGVDAYAKTLESRRLDQVRAAAGRGVHILRLYANTRNFYTINEKVTSANGDGSGAVALLQHAFQWFDQQSLDLVDFVQAVRLGGYLPPVYAMNSFDCCAKSAASAPAAAAGGSGTSQTQTAESSEIASLSPGDLTRRLLGQGAGGIVASHDWSNRHFIPHLRTAPFDTVSSKLARALGFPAVAADAHGNSLSGTGDGPSKPQNKSVSCNSNIPVPIEKLVFGSPILDVVVEFETAQQKAAESEYEVTQGGTVPIVPSGGCRRRKTKGRDSARHFPSAACGASYAEVLALLRESAGTSAKIWAAKAKQRQEFKKQREALQAQRQTKSTLVTYHRRAGGKPASGIKRKVSFQAAHRLYCRERRAEAKAKGGFDLEKGPVLAQINNGWKALDAATREVYRRRAADEAETIDKHSDKTGSSTKRKNKDRKSSSGRGKAKKRNKQDESDAESQAPTVAMFWAQCEACKKWRSLPIKWNPDTDFFCTDNKWDATRQTCEAPEEQWEQGGNYVVEGATFVPDDVEIGDYIDVQDPLNMWFAGKVVDRRNSEVLIHYLKWDSKYDEWINIDTDGWRLAELMTHVKRTKRLVAWLEKKRAATAASASSAQSPDSASRSESAATSPRSDESVVAKN